jgi:hypothetical protein
MMNHSKMLLTAAATAMAVALSGEPLLARGGPPSIMDSPGYQRRLQESRQQLAEPAVKVSPVHRHKRHPGHPPHDQVR